jgi:hypothetical protein
VPLTRKKKNKPFGLGFFVSKNLNLKLCFAKILGNKKSLLLKTFLFSCGATGINFVDPQELPSCK